MISISTGGSSGLVI